MPERKLSVFNENTLDVKKYTPSSIDGYFIIPFPKQQLYQSIELIQN